MSKINTLYSKLLFIIPIFCLSNVSGCSESEFITKPSYMTPVAYPSVIDYFHMKVPAGLRYLEYKEYVGMAKYWLVRQGQDSSSFTGIRVFRLPPDRVPGSVISDDDGDNIKVDIAKYRSEDMVDAGKAGTFKIKSFPCKMIDKTKACGYSGYSIRQNRRYFMHFWFIWRHDGLWKISIYSDPDADEIPQELIKALDTIRWERR